MFVDSCGIICCQDKVQSVDLGIILRDDYIDKYYIVIKA